MEQQLERALITTTAFGMVAVATAVGVGAAIECGVAALGCYFATSFVQRRMPGRRVANAAWERRRLRELDENLSRRSPARTATRRPDRERPARRVPAQAVVDADDLFSLNGHGW